MRVRITYITRNSEILRFLAEWKSEAVIYLSDWCVKKDFAVWVLVKIASIQNKLALWAMFLHGKQYSTNKEISFRLPKRRSRAQPLGCCPDPHGLFLGGRPMPEILLSHAESAILDSQPLRLE